MTESNTAGTSVPKRMVFEHQVKELLAARGVAVPAGVVGHSGPELLAEAGPLRSPLVLKAFGPGVVHKSDLGAVRVGLEHENLEQAVKEMGRHLGAEGMKVAGYLVEEQQPPGFEVLVGVVRRAPFPPVAVVGLGGTWTEEWDEVALGLAPLDVEEARALVERGRTGQLLKGRPGSQPLATASLVEVVMALAGPDGVAQELGEELAELECNPVRVTATGAVALDARLVLAQEGDHRRAQGGVDFTGLFRPRGVAVAGASTSKPGFGNRALAAYRAMGWSQGLYALHPRATAVEGVPAIPSLAGIEGPVDYLLVTVPADRCAEVVRASRGRVPFIQVVSSGFSESSTDTGRQLEDELLQAARDVGARLIGPNCIGTYCPGGRQTFQLGVSQRSGPVGVVSQSGGLAGDIIMVGARRGLRFSKVATVGNASDVGPGDLLEFMVGDGETTVVGLYLEGCADAGRVVAALRRGKGKVVPALLLGGQSPLGARAVVSHTGALAGDRRIWEAVAAATGATVVQRLEDLLAVLVYAQRWATQARRSAAGAVVLGVGGGASVLAADACARAGVALVPATEATVAALGSLGYGAGASLANPVEIPFGPVAGRDTLPTVLDTLLGVQPYADVLVHVNVGAYYSYATAGIAPLVDQMAALAARHWPGTRLGVVARNLQCAPGPEAEALRRALVDLDLPLFGDFDEAATAIAALQRFSLAAEASGR